MANRMFRNRFEWLSALPLLVVTGALAIIAISALTRAQSPEARSREALFDYFQRLAPADFDPSERFHLVLIDRASAEATGPWPWPRTVIAELVRAAAAAGAKGVVLTEAVDAPDPLSPETIGAFWLEGASDDALARQLARLPRTDEALAAAFEATKGAVAVAHSAPHNPNRENSLARADAGAAAWIAVDEANVNTIALPATRYFYPVNEALARAARPAVSALEPDGDGVLRRTPLLWSLDGAPVPALALEAARLAVNQDLVTATVKASAASAQGRIIDTVEIGGAALALTATGGLRFYPPRRMELPTTSAARLLPGLGGTPHIQGGAPRSSLSQLSGAVVLIGLDGELGAKVRTARGEIAPAAAHALIAAQIVAGEAPQRPGWAGYLEALAVMAFGAGAIMAAQRFSFWRVMGGAALLSALLLIGAFAAFAFVHLLLDPLAPALALFVGGLSVAGGKSIGGALRDDNYRGSFHDTLPEAAMQRLRTDDSGDLLEGVSRDITVLACELRLADEDLQRLENCPDDVTKLLASASLDLRQSIIDTGGAADQAEGGRIFGYYNAPLEMADHTQAGCAAALRLIESMDKINADLESSSRTRGLQIHLAIGIATGPCFIGPMGHGRNNRYSAVGPAVDRAVFLRAQSEYYGPAMITDESTHKETHHHFAFLELDKIRLRSAKRPFSIYALIGNPFIKSSRGFRNLDEAHRKFLAAYRAGDANAAREMLDAAKKSPGAKIALFDIYEERMQRVARHGFPQNWDGVHEAAI